MYAPHCAADELFEEDCVERCKCAPCICEKEESECDYEECDCDASCGRSQDTDDWDDENGTIVRGKWMFDGCKTISEMVEALQKQILILEEMKSEGWEVSETVHDDYAHLHRYE
jgi:hypothetical protein